MLLHGVLKREEQTVLANLNRDFRLQINKDVQYTGGRREGESVLHTTGTWTRTTLESSRSCHVCPSGKEGVKWLLCLRCFAAANVVMGNNLQYVFRRQEINPYSNSMEIFRWTIVIVPNFSCVPSCAINANYLTWCRLMYNLRSDAFSPLIWKNSAVESLHISRALFRVSKP